MSKKSAGDKATSKGGEELKEGDTVSVKFTVASVSGSQVTLTSTEKAADGSSVSVSCDACCCEKCDG